MKKVLQPVGKDGFSTTDRWYIYKAPEAVVEAWLNEDYSTLLREFKVFHSPTGHYWQLGILTTLPLEKAVKAWNALTLSPHTDTEYAMLNFGLKGLPGLVNSLARYPQEALPITNYFAASELAPAVARAFNKLKTLRENARSWLLKYPEHALTGLLPAALGKAGEARITPALPCVCLPKTVISHYCKKSPDVITSRK
ncbi:hypothetical protein ACLK10_11815 [Escherichia coli]